MSLFSLGSHPMPPLRPRHRKCRPGFALIITVVLVAFLVLLLVALASFTRVETTVAANMQQFAGARQNALMALNVALGRLQAAAGPDQRVTATADIVTGTHDDKRRWTGVWDVTTASPAPVWLVSTADATQPSGASSVTTALSSADTVELVGANTIDASVAGERVRVERQAITSETAPGLGGTDHTVGHIAWWVGDEGVKAKVSLRDPWAASGATAEQQGYRLRVAQRMGIERVDAASGAALDSAYPANAEAIAKVFDLRQLPMIDSAGSGALTTAAKNRFHDLTAGSWSVLADVAQGGLKKDLTAWLAHPSVLPADAPADDDHITRPAADDGTGFGLPRWGLLRSYAGIERGAALAPRPHTDRQQGAHPVITYFRMGYSASCDEDTPANPTPPLRIHVFPVLVLWNPYDTPLAAAQYEVAYGSRYNTATGVFIRPNAGDSDDPSWQVPPNLRKGRLVMSTAAMNNDPAPTPNGDQSVRRYFRFLVDSPVLQPGQSLVFTLDDTGPYTAGLPDEFPNRMSPHADYRKDNSAWFENAGMTMTADEIWVDKTTRAERKKLYVLTNGGEFETGLFPAQAEGANPTVAEMLAQNPYQLVQHIGLTEYTRRITPVGATEIDDTYICTYHWFQLQMSRAQTYFRTPRWLAQSNPRAPYHMASGDFLTQSFIGSSYSGVPTFNTFDGNLASSGDHLSAPPVIDTVLAGFADGAASAPWKRFFSLAQFQHASASTLAQAPGYAIGNSGASYHIYKADGSVGLADTSVSGTVLDSASVRYPANQIKRFYDLSYLLNRELWDRYYFSTIPSAGAEALTDSDIASSAYHLPNSRNVIRAGATAADLASASAFDRAAAGLLVNGGFNVNSTSVQAWRALLAAHNGVDATGAFTHPFARFSGTRAGDSANQSWSSGYRILSDAQIDALAEKIVAEVRARGPFVSLADFVNRRLRNDATGYKGPLQAAIDATDAESAAARRINDRAPFNDYSADTTTSHRIMTYGTTTASAATTAAFQQLLRGGATTTNTPSASRAAHAPGFLTQADLLQSIGPVLAARSDTFLVRAYGDVQNPATNEVEGRAWCEAVVQRLPEYVDDTLDAWAAPAAGTPNALFGRRFKIVSFRWLTDQDI